MSTDKLGRVCVILTALFAICGAIGADRSTTPKPVPAQLASRPLTFEPNRGQTDKQVDFLAHGAGYGLFLSHGEAVMVLGHSATVRMWPAGANLSAAAEPLDRQPGKTNYFIGNKPESWQTGIPNFAKVRYRNVYRGIDLVYYGNQKQLEYDFVVGPGANPDDILLDFQGVAKPTLDRSGDLVMHTAVSDLRWHKPVVYQDVNGSRKVIECAYVRKGTHYFAFGLGAYDRSKALVIDPVLDYSTYLGGSASDGGIGIAVDRFGDVYVTGYTQSPDFPTKDGFQKTLKGNQNAFVTKIDAADCALVYSTYLGGSGGDEGYGIALDALGNAYITGSSYSPDFPVTKDAFQKSLKGATNAFVTKLDAGGSALVYSTYLGGSGSDSAAGIAVDAHDSAYVTGTTTSPDFPTSHPFQENLKSTNGNAFVAKFDAAGTALIYSTYLGGSGFGERGNGIAVDGYGNAYVAGLNGSTDFPTKHAFQPKPEGGFVTKFDATGTALVYSTYLGGGGDEASAIAVDAGDNAYVTGWTGSPNFPTKNAFQPKNKESLYPTAFVTKFNAAGTALVYSTYLGGSKHKQFARYGTLAAGIAVDTQGNAYVSGQTGDTDFPVKNAFQPTQNGFLRNGFVTKFCPAGTLVYSSYLGGSSDDIAVGVAVDKNGSAYVTGIAGSSDFPVKNAFQKKLKGSNNAFVTKISAR